MTVLLGQFEEGAVTAVEASEFIRTMTDRFEPSSRSIRIPIGRSNGVPMAGPFRYPTC